METPTQTEVSADDVCKQMMQCMQHYVEAMHTEGSSWPRGRIKELLKEVKFWCCGQSGHFQRDCPESQGDDTQSPITPTTSQQQ